MFKMEVNYLSWLDPLCKCLRSRASAGSKLKHLRIMDDSQMTHRFSGVIRPLVDVLEVDTPKTLGQRVSPGSMGRMGVN